MKKKDQNLPKKKGGRPKGSKSKLPFTTFQDALKYAKMIWEKAEYKEMSFKEISNFMGLHPQVAVRVLNALKDFYGIVEQLENGNWRLTDAGKRAAKHEYTALIEVFTKNKMFGELFNTFYGKNVTEGAILSHIEKNYKYVDAEEVKNRLLEGIQIIESAKKQSEQTIPTISKDKGLLLFQLKYALKPPSTEEISALVEKVADTLKESNDDVLKLISDLMMEKKANKEELFALLIRAMKRLGLTVEEEVGKSTHKKGVESLKGESAEGT
jgi:hypothetical protein